MAHGATDIASAIYTACEGSVCELQDDFNTCEDEQYFEKPHLDDIRLQAVKVIKLINGYVAYLGAEAEKSGHWSVKRRCPTQSTS